MAEYRVQVTAEVTAEDAHWSASTPALRGSDARFFAAQRPHREKFVPAGIAA
jgi:hypothetical protein